MGGPIREKLIGKEMLAGSIAGGLADSLMYPMMTVKSRIQVKCLMNTLSTFFGSDIKDYAEIMV